MDKWVTLARLKMALLFAFIFLAFLLYVMPLRPCFAPLLYVMPLRPCFAPLLYVIALRCCLKCIA
jgi:hypothetical protein